LSERTARGAGQQAAEQCEIAVVRGFVAPTDHGWYQFFLNAPAREEVNFWRPGGLNFRAIEPGEPFFFKLKGRHDAIGGFGIFARSARLPVWALWDVFGSANGTHDERELRERLARLSGNPWVKTDNDRMIGCLSISTPVFFPPDEWVPTPRDWHANIVSGRRYDLSEGEGRLLWQRCLDTAQRHAAAPLAEVLEPARIGRPYVFAPRLGQGAFRLAVLDAYGGACAVTTEHSLPVLDAAHIRPWASGGENVVRNGIPLRRDLHRLFDLGYVSIRPNHRLIVSADLREQYENGKTYYALQDRTIALPEDPSLQPDKALLEWHAETVFRS